MNVPHALYEKPEEENKDRLSRLGKEIQLKSFKKNILENGDELHLKIIIAGDPKWKERVTSPRAFCTPWLHREEISWKSGTNLQEYTLKIQFWELAPIDRFLFLCGRNCNLFKACDGALVFFDVDKPSSLSSALQYCKLIQSANPSTGRNGFKVPVVLVMINNSNQNECRGEDAKIKVEMDSYCQQHGFVTWFECLSRKTDSYKRVYTKAAEKVLDEVISLSRKGVTIWGDWKLKYGIEPYKI